MVDTERPNSIRTLKGMVLWLRMYKKSHADNENYHTFISVNRHLYYR